MQTARLGHANAEPASTARRMFVKMEMAALLRRIWGDKPCKHPSFDKEYYVASWTGDYVCKQCGRSFTEVEMREIERNR